MKIIWLGIIVIALLVHQSIKLDTAIILTAIKVKKIDIKILTRSFGLNAKTSSYTSPF